MHKMKIVDAKGLSCPQPVLLTKKTLEAGAKEFEVLVNDYIPKENVKRFCNSNNCEITETKTTDGWKLVIRQKSEGRKPAEPPQQNKPDLDACPTLLITCNKIGLNDDLGKILMEGLINTLPTATKKPACIFFMNEGVFLTTTNSPVLKALKQLEATGIIIGSCGTCLDFYQLKDNLQVGTITNMYDIVETLTSSSVIKI
jgi:selenium metabolism protein YedF